MTKEQLVSMIQEKAALESKSSAENVFDAILDSIESGLKSDGPVSIRGFGTFSIQERASRQGRNPQTGEPIQIPASRTVKFTPGKELRELANLKSPEREGWLKNREILRNMDSALRDFKKSFDGYMGKSGKIGNDARRVYKDNMQRIRPKYEEARLKFKLLRSSSGDAWEEMRGGLEKAFGELKEAFNRAKNKM